MDEEHKKIKWPSERIPQGGLFHSSKPKYSQETTDLIKLLMEESRMSMMLQKEINNHLRSGNPLPTKCGRQLKLHEDNDVGAMEIIRKARIAKRKTLRDIVASGAYTQQKYHPKPDIRVPSEKAKVHLQEAMSGFKAPITNLKPLHKRREAKSVTTDERIDEILEQINERAMWLAEMEELGEGKKYREEIRCQIAARLKEIKHLEAKQKLLDSGCQIIED